MLCLPVDLGDEHHGARERVPIDVLAGAARGSAPNLSVPVRLELHAVDSAMRETSRLYPHRGSGRPTAVDRANGARGRAVGDENAEGAGAAAQGAERSTAHEHGPMAEHEIVGVQSPSHPVPEAHVYQKIAV